MDGEEFSSPVNADIIKKYYAWGNKKNDLPKLKTRKGDCGKYEKSEEKKKKKKKKNGLRWKLERAV